LTELDLTEISLDHLEELKCVKNKLILIKFPKGIVLPLLKVIELDEKFLKPEGFQI
jgi:hypothetical protein